MSKLDILSELPNWLVADAEETIKKYNFDASHDMTHFVNTFLFAKQIIDEEFENAELIENLSLIAARRVTLYSAFIHDRVDGKYMNVEEEVHLFREKAIKNNLSIPEVDAIIYIITNMSFSKRMERMRNNLPMIEKSPYELALKIVIDADQLEAYRIERTELYQTAIHGYKQEPERSKLINGWIKTILVKRVLLYKDHFMNTNTGKREAAKRHDGVQNYVDEKYKNVEMFGY